MLMNDTEDTARPPALAAGAVDHIGVCVPTFKRPELLSELLLALGRQKVSSQFDYSVHVIDNDPAMSAQSVVVEFAGTAPFPVTYDVEPVQNIALARNRAVQRAFGNFIAFIDDDEHPTDDWLGELYEACRRYDADGVLGPVKPLFGPDAPPWLERSRLCERPSHQSGTVLVHLQTRTGNVLFKRSILNGVEVPFLPEKGRTGGEDIEFFRSMIARGSVFVWCQEAPVYERVPANRYTRRFYLDKSLRMGGLTGEMLRDAEARKVFNSGPWPAALRSACALFVHIPSAAGGLLWGHHVAVRHLVKCVYHFGRICGCLGIVPVRFRRDA